TPLKQLANLSVPESRLVVVQPWDQSIIKEIEKAILRSELGLTPSNDGKLIRIAIPPLTEERRRELVKVVRRMAEDHRISVRNIRRDGNEALKEMEKKKELSEDDLRRGQSEIQKITAQFIKEVDDLAAKKEQEVMEV
ncbi:MAG: ribosome recycling factor, partial [Nitrospinota bacterium]